MKIAPLPQRLAATLAMTSVLALLSSQATAQDDRIQLRSLDGAMSLEGTFIGFRDGVYVVDHDSLGTLRIEASDQITCTGAACPTPVAEPEPVAVTAPSQVITLTTGDGRLAIEGVFVELTTDSYIIDSETLGRLAIEIHPDVQCIGEACPEIRPANADRLIVGTSREMATLLSPLLEAYASSKNATLSVSAINEDGQVPVSLTDANGTLVADYLIATMNSDDALAQLVDRSASMVVTDRRMTDADVITTGVPDLRGTLGEHKLAQDGLVFVTHPDNAIRALSAQEIAQIWSGQVTNWLTLGGGNRDIAFGSALSATVDQGLFNSRILAANGANVDAGAQFDSPAALVAATQSNAGTIGIMRRSDVIDTGLKVIDIRETCGLLSQADEFSIKNGGYLLGQEVYSYTASEFATPELADFAQWVATSAAEAVIEQQNYVNATPGRMALQDMGLTLVHTAAVEPDFNGLQFAQTMRELREAERTSVTFRFDEGAATLDRDSFLAVNKLAQQVAEGQFSGFEILLVGFSDSSGPNAGNTALALNRANAVLAALQQSLPAGNAANVQISTLSAGELMPLSCNTSADGRERNRRVETWLRLVQG